jgi:hypothetical protein
MDNMSYLSNQPQKLCIKYIGQENSSNLSRTEILSFNLSTQYAFSETTVRNIAVRSANYAAINAPDKKHGRKHPYNIFSSGNAPESQHIAN